MESAEGIDKEFEVLRDQEEKPTATLRVKGLRRGNNILRTQ